MLQRLQGGADRCVVAAEANFKGGKSQFKVNLSLPAGVSFISEHVCNVMTNPIGWSLRKGPCRLGHDKGRHSMSTASIRE